MNTVRKKLTINATSAIIQVAFTAILYFFLYKYLLNWLGIDLLGVWSLILSFSSIANLANLGLTSGLVKFVAEYLAGEEEYKIGELILTSLISLTVLFTIVSLLILFGSNYFIHYIIDNKYLDIAFSILPISLASLCINAISGVFTSVLEGFQKNYLRNLIYIFSGVLMFIVTVFLTPRFGLKGVAYAQLIQAVFVFFSAFILSSAINRFNRILHWKWSKKSFNEIFNYGFKFQVVSICQLLYEPTTKILLGKFGGLAMLGHYEMATKLINQFRALLVSANQVVIPVVTESTKTKTKEYKQTFYINMNRIMALFVFPLTTFVIVLAPVISSIWIGNIEFTFIYSVCVLSLGYIVNIMSGPAFFSCMGEGFLNIPIISHVSMALINILVGIFLGFFYGGYGIILAWAIASTLGSFVTIFLYNKRIGVNYKKILSQNERLLVLVSILLILISILLFSVDIIGVNIYLKTFLYFLVCLIAFYIVIRKNYFISELVKNINRSH